MKTLVLIDNNKNGFFPSRIDNCIISEIYKSNRYYNRVIRKVVMRLGGPFCSFFFAKWKRIKKEPDLIILFDTGNAKYILRYLRRKYLKSRIVLWFWNSVDNTIDPNEYDMEGVELWSFDPIDCKKHHMNYNTQFFVANNINKEELGSEIKRDIFFVGTDKGRLQDLSELKKKADHNGISYDFHIVGNVDQEIPGWGVKYRNGISYKEVLKNNSESKAIIDIVSKGQNGITLRPLEALFLKKKLITNFKRIKEYDFYNKDNIFIMGEDDWERLNSFLSEPYNDFYDARYYEIRRWIRRFYRYSSVSNDV